MCSKQILLEFSPWSPYSTISTRVGPGVAGAVALLALSLRVVGADEATHELVSR